MKMLGMVGVDTEGRHFEPKRHLCRCLIAAVLFATAYVLSFGPACWIMTRVDPFHSPGLVQSFSGFYRPVAFAIIRTPLWARQPIHRYLELGAPPDADFIKGWPDGIGWSKPGYTYTVLSCSSSSP